MARTKYGPVVIAVPGTGGTLTSEKAPLVVSRTEGGVPEADLTDVNGNAITAPDPDDVTGATVWFGPDGYTGSMWVQDPVTSLWWEVQPVGLANRTGGVSSISLNGGPQLTGAVPLTVDTTTVTGLTSALAAKVDSSTLTTAIDNEVAAYNTAHPQFVVINAGDPIPDVPAGQLLVIVPAGVGQPAFTSLFASVRTTDGTTFATDSVTPAAGSVTLLHVAAGRTDGTADHPTSVTGAGLTWTRVASVKTTAGNTASSLWLGTGTPTAGAITATFATTMMNCGLRVTQVTGVATTGTVVQGATAYPANTTPAVTLSGVNAANPVVGYYTAQSASQTATVGDGYTELGVQATATDGPTILTDAEYRLDGVNLVNWTASSTAQKTIIAVELKKA